MSYPNWVLAGIVAGLQDLVATIEAIANGARLDPTQVANFRLQIAVGPQQSASSPAPTIWTYGLMNAMSALYNAIPMLVVSNIGIDPSVAAGIAAIARATALAMDADSAVAAFAGAAAALPDPVASPAATINRQVDAQNKMIVARLSRMVLLGCYAEAMVRVVFETRPDAITARANSVVLFENELSDCVGAVDLSVVNALTAIRNSLVNYLSEAIIKAAPVMTVSTGVSMPVLWCSHRVYGDVDHAVDLVDRNAVMHPSFMPTSFEALAPASS